MQNKFETKNKKKMAKAKFEQNICDELFSSWKFCRRTEDIPELMEITGKSYPIIYRALTFGHVKNESVANDISTFYAQRTLKQKQQAKEILKNLA